MPMHVPLVQVSVMVHALPSLHAVPLALAGFEHAPVVGSQVPASWHWSGVGQVTGLEPMQAPLWQVSVCVQALPSLHTVPLALAGSVHWPVVGSQVPTVWHWSLGVQATGLPPTTPLWQMSGRVQ